MGPEATVCSFWGPRERPRKGAARSEISSLPCHVGRGVQGSRGEGKGRKDSPSGSWASCLPPRSLSLQLHLATLTFINSTPV